LPPKAKQHRSPAPSSTKSAVVSSLAPKAQRALDRVLAQKSQLPLGTDAPAAPGEQRGRERLKGAFLIELSRIRPDPAQPRRHVQDESIHELAASIRRLGVVQAISVRYIVADDVYQIISGERRFQAAKLAELPTIPCIVANPDEKEILVRQIVENWQRKHLHPFEIADSLAQLRDSNGYTQKQLAEETGKSEGEVSKLLKLLDLAPAVQKEARADPTGMLSFKHLYHIARLTIDDQTAVAAVAREQRLTAEETESLVRKTIVRRSAAPKRGAPVTRVQYVTTKAKIVLTFRKQTVEPSDILAALDEAREKADPEKRNLNIERR
jgi:ParB family chromosome partitioning protein